MKNELEMKSVIYLLARFLMLSEQVIEDGSVFFVNSLHFVYVLCYFFHTFQSLCIHDTYTYTYIYIRFTNKRREFSLLLNGQLYLDLPIKCWCSSLLSSVRFRSCCKSKGYFNIRWIGLIKYDSNVDECCCLGFRACRNSCKAWFPSSVTDTMIFSLFF